MRDAHLNKSLLLAACVVLAMIAVPGIGSAQTKPIPGDAPRLARAASNLMPLGRVLEAAAAEDPKWPINDKPDAMDATQLACVRQIIQNKPIVHGREVSARRIEGKANDHIK